MRQDIVGIDLSQLFSWKAFQEAFMYSFEKPWFFTEFSFLFVFGIFLLLYAFLVNQNFWRKLYIIAFSLFFYYKSSGPFIGLFALMIISDYIFAIQIHKADGVKKKIYLILALVYSSSFLLYFKYSNFFIDNCNYLLGTHFKTGDLFLPIGISFYTFQSISYILDVYRKEIPPAKNFSDYTFYMTFFPHLVAGPIVRAKDFLPQITDPQIINAALYKEGITRITIGLVKKLFIADYLAKYIDLVHAAPEGFTGGEHLISMYAYSFQIYFDFSGYSDIAIGIALMLGYRLKENFDNPYAAENITVFWRKWHISLSQWLRDYIYIPLGGNRRGVFNMYLFLLITMLVGGFWHGADWRFVFWGLAHGLALAGHKLFTKYIPMKNSILSRTIGIILTFHFVGVCWIFFRSTSFDSAFLSIQKILTNMNLNDFVGFWYARPEIICAIFISSFIVFTPQSWKTTIFRKLERIPAFLWVFIVLISLQLIIQFKDEVVQPFIYFQF
ncbi:MAG: MBOAT family O-acyltransferase [Bacteroidota bacterium]|jgi:alginate O-acetyltransferase complex protein AlgI